MEEPTYINEVMQQNSQVLDSWDDMDLSEHESQSFKNACNAFFLSRKMPCKDNDYNGRGSMFNHPTSRQ